MKRQLLIAVSLMMLLSSALPAQVVFYRDTTIQVIHQNQQLKLAWGSGFNSPVFAVIDLNGDARLDLISYETQSGRLNPFLNTGASNDAYVYAPQYRTAFPAELEGWVRTYDFDHDGDMDLFTYNNAGIRVYRNEYNTSMGLNFTLFNTQLMTHYGSFQTNIYVSRVNMPALSDVDNDGDMDVLSFSIAGNWVEHHKNLSVDSTGNPNGFLFYNIPQCWGYFALSGSSNVAQLPVISTCPLLPADPFRLNPDLESVEERARHAGSALLALDMDGDGDKDLLNGDILSPNLLYLENCGTPDSAYVCSQDTLFPVYDVPAMMNDVAGPYYFDVDNDGNNDLLVANFYTGEDLHNIRYYRNTTNNTTNVFSFQSDRFLSEEMIETGTGSHPVFFDMNADGLDDLIIGNDFYYNGNTNTGQLAYYQNTGTAAKAEFTLIDDDLLNLSQMNIRNLYPTFGDLDGDGDKDLLIGENTGTLLYFQNIAGQGNPANFIFSQANYQSIDVGDNATPQLADVDRDGLPDLIIGERNGTLNYYRNTGNASLPIFSLVSQNFGGVNVIKVNSFAGYSAPVLFEYNGSYELLVGSESGFLYHYTNIDGNLSGNFTLADSMFHNIWEPVRSTPAIGDIDGDSKYDLVIGNLSGGCVLYSQNTALPVHDVSLNDFGFNIYPNPVQGLLTIQTDHFLPAGSYYTITDLSGRIIEYGGIRSLITVDVSGFPSGAYLCTLTGPSGRNSKLIIKSE